MIRTFSVKENSFIAKLAARKLGSNRMAIVMGHCIHLHGVSKKDFLQNERWLRHELKHVEQYAKHGFIGFIAKYLWHSLIYGYHNCCYEKEARAAEDDEAIITHYKAANDADQS